MESEDETAMWELPSTIARKISQRDRRDLSFLEVKGDSMEPTLQSGEPILVSTNPDDLAPWNGGLFVISDGVGVMVKRIEYIPRSEPVRFRVISDNERYATYELTAEEVHISARVLASLHRH